MDLKITPRPWAQSDSQPTYVFRDNLGMIDFSAPVAVFRTAEDARHAVKAVNSAQRSQRRPQVFDLVEHLARQRAFSEITFGPGMRTAGVLDHIRKELREIEAAPGDLPEWIDVILLACDGAWRAGHEPETIAAALGAKLAKNETRDWPDWRTTDPDKAIEHVRRDACDTEASS